MEQEVYLVTRYGENKVLFALRSMESEVVEFCARKRYVWHRVPLKTIVDGEIRDRYEVANDE
jgi:hypothetical protein